MIKEIFTVKNYLEPINLNFFKVGKRLKENKEKECKASYPFTKEQFFSHVATEESLSFNEKSDQKNEKYLDPLDITLFLEKMPLEKKLREIEFEKRRRYQAYKSLEYNLSNITYFDFFSLDSFQILKNAKFLAQIYGKSEVNSDLFILSFFNTNFAIGKLLKELGFDEIFTELFSRHLKKELDEQTMEYIGKKKENAQKNFSFFDKIEEKMDEILIQPFRKSPNVKVEFDQNIKYSYEIHQLFEKATENSLKRFKTPIITPEILFFTLMEEKSLKLGKRIRKILNDETAWYFIRYKLLKRLYGQEISIRKQVVKNQYFFAYLLKTQLSELDFAKLIKKKSLSKTVGIFRNKIIQQALEENFFDSFDIETHVSIGLGSQRSYSI